MRILHLHHRPNSGLELHRNRPFPRTSENRDNLICPSPHHASDHNAHLLVTYKMHANRPWPLAPE